MEIEAKTGFAEVPIDIEPVEDTNPKNNWKMIALVSGASVLVAVLALFMLWPSKDGDQRIPQPGGTSAEPRASTGPLPRQEDDTGSRYKIPSAPPPSAFDKNDDTEDEVGVEEKTEDEDEEVGVEEETEEDDVAEDTALNVAGNTSLNTAGDTEFPISYPSPQDFKFNKNNSFEIRKSEVENALSDHPGYVPVVAEVFNCEDLQSYTGLFNPQLEISYTKSHLLRTFNFNEVEYAMRIFVDGKEYVDDRTIGDVAGEHLNEDGNLYLSCTIERIDSFKFKLKYSYFLRQDYNRNLLIKYPDTSSVVIETVNDERNLMFYGSVDRETTILNLKTRFKEKYQLSPTEHVHLYLNGEVLADDEALLSNIHEMNAEADSNLYLACFIYAEGGPDDYFSNSRNYKLKYLPNVRRMQAKELLTRYPSFIPVIFEIYPPHEISPICISFPSDYSVAEAREYLTEQWNASPDESLRLTCHNGFELDDTLIMSKVYAQYQDEDGYLYVGAKFNEKAVLAH